MQFTSSDEYFYRHSNINNNNNNNNDHNKLNDTSRMQQKSTTTSSNSMTSSSHSVNNLLSNTTTSDLTTNAPSLIDVLSQLSEPNTSNYDLQKFLQKHQLAQLQTDEKMNKKILNESDSVQLSSSVSVTSTSSSSSSSSSSPNNTPGKKKALSEVITKLRKKNDDDPLVNRTTNSKTINANTSNDLELETHENDSAHNNSSNNDYSASVGDDTDYVNDEANEDDDDDEDDNGDDDENEDEDDEELKAKKSINNSSRSSGIDIISNASSSNSNLMHVIPNELNDYNLTSAAEQITALINSAITSCTNNTQNLTSSPASSASPLPQQQQYQQQQTSKIQHQQVDTAKENINRINNLIMNSTSSNKKSQIELLKLLEKANLTQYMSVFIEQGGDDIDQLVEANDDEFKEIVDLVGMSSKPLHVKRLRKAIDEYKNSKNKNDHATVKSSAFLSTTASTISNNNSDQNTSQSISLSSNKFSSDSSSLNCSLNTPNTFYNKTSSSSSSTSSTSSISSSSTSGTSSNPFSIRNICQDIKTTTTTTSTPQQSTPPLPPPLPPSSSSSTSTTTPFQNQNSVAAFYPAFYQFLNQKNFIQHQQLFSSGLVPPSLTNQTTISSHDTINTTPSLINTNSILKGSCSQQKQLQTKEDSEKNGETEGSGIVDEEIDDEEVDDEADEDEVDETDEENFENEDDDEYEEEMNQDNEDDTINTNKSESKSHSSKKKTESKQSALLQHQQQILQPNLSQTTPTTSSNIKIEQNEKMIKKNKVIELYSKGERCVRKLSQQTGVPLTTVYRVIGKLKGINYNIPRGNGAGRKTILDAQDREILVEILNVTPRISRKALGKELEKRTGKSIHNSTLNRELCRLRHHGHNFAAVNPVSSSNLINTNSGASLSDSNQLPSMLSINTENNNNNQNYLKHFNTNRKQSSSSSSPVPSINSTNATTINSLTNLPNKQSLNNTNNRSLIKPTSSSAATGTLDKSKQTKNKLDKLDIDSIKQITNESKRFCSTLSKSETEMNLCNSNSNLLAQINELYQLNNAEMRLNKTKQLVNALFKEDNSFNSFTSEYYILGLIEACVHLCLNKPSLLTRKNELLSHARRILENCQINDENKSKSEMQVNKRIKLEKTDDESIKQQKQLQQQISQQQINQQLQLYTAALAIHFQSGVRNNQFQDLLSRFPMLQSPFLNTTSSSSSSSSSSSTSNDNLELKQRQLFLLEEIESKLKLNQKYQDELKSKLALLAASSPSDQDDQMKQFAEQLKVQLNDLVRKQSDLLCEQNRLKNDLDSFVSMQPVSSFNFNNQLINNNTATTTNEYEEDDNKSSISLASSKSSSRYESKPNENDKRLLLTGNSNDNFDQDESIEINDDENLNQKL